TAYLPALSAKQCSVARNLTYLYILAAQQQPSRQQTVSSTNR
ncbi:MAG: hypothetical protein ACI9OF_001322, partial [Saprospiraceae bacterium]